MVPNIPADLNPSRLQSLLFLSSYKAQLHVIKEGNVVKGGMDVEKNVDLLRGKRS